MIAGTAVETTNRRNAAAQEVEGIPPLYYGRRCLPGRRLPRPSAAHKPPLIIGSQTRPVKTAITVAAKLGFA